MIVALGFATPRGRGNVWVEGCAARGFGVYRASCSSDSFFFERKSDQPSTCGVLARARASEPARRPRAVVACVCCWRGVRGERGGPRGRRAPCRRLSAVVVPEQRIPHAQGHLPGHACRWASPEPLRCGSVGSWAVLPRQPPRNSRILHQRGWSAPRCWRCTGCTGCTG